MSQIKPTKLEGVYVIEHQKFDDDRGFFREIYEAQMLNQVLGFEFLPVQANHSRSFKNVVRGLHIAPWHKLVTVYSGEVLQLVADTRPNSKTFGEHIMIDLGEQSFKSVFIPKGCGNGFSVLSDKADYCYLTTDYWSPGKESYVNYADPDLQIDWRTKTPIVSEQDKIHPTLRQVFPQQF